MAPSSPAPGAAACLKEESCQGALCVLLGRAQSWEEPEARHSHCCGPWKARRHVRPLSPPSYSGSLETLLSLAQLLSPSPGLWWAFQFLGLGSLDFHKKFIPYLNGFCLKMFFLVPFRKWHNYKWYRQKWSDGRELLPADLPVTKVNSALMKLLRGLSGHEKLFISFFSNRHFNPNHIFLKIELKCFSILFCLGWLCQISYFAVLFSTSFSHCLLIQ